MKKYSIILSKACGVHWKKEANSIIEEFVTKNKGKENIEDQEQSENAPIEEILQLLRKQNVLLSSPEKLIPLDYIEWIQDRIFERNREQYFKEDIVGEELIQYLRKLMERVREFSFQFDVNKLLECIRVEELIAIIKSTTPRNRRRLLNKTREIERELHQIEMGAKVIWKEHGEKNDNVKIIDLPDDSIEDW